jgi:hypothetical protein
LHSGASITEVAGVIDVVVREVDPLHVRGLDEIEHVLEKLAVIVFVSKMIGSLPLITIELR